MESRDSTLLNMYTHNLFALTLLISAVVPMLFEFVHFLFEDMMVLSPVADVSDLNQWLIRLSSLHITASSESWSFILGIVGNKCGSVWHQFVLLGELSHLQ